MKKLLILVFFMLIFLTGCNNEYTKLTFDESKLTNKLHFIYKLSDESNFYSMYEEITYNDPNGKSMPLGEALSKKYITIDEIISEMEFVTYNEGLNEIGTKVYRYDVNRQSGLANVNLLLIQCNTLDNVKDVVLGSNANLIYCSDIKNYLTNN